MRLNALHPADNPLEELLFCFGSDGDDGDSGSDSDIDAISAEFEAMDRAYDRGESFTSQGVTTGGGSDVDTSLQASQAPMASGYGIGSQGFVQEAIRGFTGPQTQTIGQATSYPGGMNISPYSPSSVTFADQTTARTYDPLGQQEAVRMNMGVTPGVREGEQTLADRIKSGFEGAFTDTAQRAAMFDPQTGRFTTPTMEKVDENRYADFAVNLLNPFKMFTGVIDTADYAPLTGGETYQFSQMTGGLLDVAGLGGPQLKSYSELEAMSNMGFGDGDDTTTMMVETETPTEEEEVVTPSPFEVGTPYVPARSFAPGYQPFNANFYQIPQRFRSGLLG